MSVEEQNKALVREVTEQIWNQRRLELIPQYYSPEYVADYQPYARSTGLDGIRGMVERTVATFPDYHEELKQLVAEGDFVVARLINSGTQKGKWGPLAATGKRVETEEIVILEIRDGKIVRQRGVVDNLNALRQLGAIPSPR
jgi:predicted ester cyclase